MISNKVISQHAKRELAKRNYKDYVVYAHEGLYKHGRHTELVCQKLEEVLKGKDKRIMLFMPPRHSKSMTVSESFPSYYLLKNPNKRVIIASYGSTLANQFGSRNKQKIELCGELFGLELSKSKASSSLWEFKGYRGGLLSTGIGSSITGHGADLLIIDDPIKNHVEADSITYRDRVYNEYKSTLRTRLQPHGSIIIILTRWHEDDLAGRLLQEARDNGEQWDIVSLPAICESEDDLLNRNIGDPLFPELKYDLDWAKMTEREVGSRTWNALYQQRPSAAEGNIIKREWFKFYDRLPNEFDDMCISVDASFKDNEESDFVVMQVWGKKGADKYLIDQLREKLGFSATVNALRTMVGRYPKAYTKLIEDKANGSAIIDYLKHEVPGIVPISPKETKIARLSAVSIDFESGNVYFPNPVNCRWSADAIEEIVSFPNAKNDDIVDACSQALQRWQHPTQIWIGRA